MNLLSMVYLFVFQKNKTQKIILKKRKYISCGRTYNEKEKNVKFKILFNILYLKQVYMCESFREYNKIY